MKGVGDEGFGVELRLGWGDEVGYGEGNKYVDVGGEFGMLWMGEKNGEWR